MRVVSQRAFRASARLFGWDGRSRERAVQAMSLMMAQLSADAVCCTVDNASCSSCLRSIPDPINKAAHDDAPLQLLIVGSLAGQNRLKVFLLGLIVAACRLRRRAARAAASSSTQRLSKACRRGGAASRRQRLRGSARDYARSNDLHFVRGASEFGPSRADELKPVSGNTLLAQPQLLFSPRVAARCSRALSRAHHRRADL